MKRFTNYLTLFALGALALFTVSCDNNDEIQVDPDAQFDVVLKVKEDSSETTAATYNVTSSTGDHILSKVRFETTTSTMKRMYITVSSQGAAPVAYDIQESVDLKGDGALDLEKGTGKLAQYQFKLLVPDSLKSGNGTLVYTFWATSGNGDFRDMDKRLVLGPATITLKFGTAVNPDDSEFEVKSFADVKLLAPTSDGKSKTFVSLVDGLTYNVSEGIEDVYLWDIGYLYSNTDKATLRAPYNYNVPYYPGVLTQPIIDIVALSGTSNDDLNKTYFKASTKTAAEFDAVAKSKDLSFVTVTASDDNVRINQLVAGSIVEFVDNYGKKGLIKVLEVKAGQGSTDYIRIAIKVQP